MCTKGYTEARLKKPFSKGIKENKETNIEIKLKEIHNMMIRDSKGRFTKKATAKTLPMRDAKGRFIKAKTTTKGKATPMRDAKGRFVKVNNTTSAPKKSEVFKEMLNEAGLEIGAKGTKKYAMPKKPTVLDSLKGLEKVLRGANKEFRTSIPTESELNIPALAFAVIAENPPPKNMTKADRETYLDMLVEKALDKLTNEVGACECDDAYCCGQCKEEKPLDLSVDTYEAEKGDQILLPQQKQVVREATDAYVSLLKEVFSEVDENIKVEVAIKVSSIDEDKRC